MLGCVSGAHVCGHTEIGVEVRDQPWCHSSSIIYIGFFKEAISLAWSLTCALRGPQESACFCLQVYVWILGIEIRSSHSLRGNYLYYLPSPVH